LVKEAVPADIEAEALVLRGAGDPSHHVIAFEHRDGMPLLGEEIGRGQTGRPRPDHDRAVAGLDPGYLTRPWC
jgi:hypothetical protein